MFAFSKSNTQMLRDIEDIGRNNYDCNITPICFLLFAPIFMSKFPLYFLGVTFTNIWEKKINMSFISLKICSSVSVTTIRNNFGGSGGSDLVIRPVVYRNRHINV